MIFSSIFFLSVFLPMTLVLYFVVPKTWRNGVLLLVSLLFYAWGEPIYIFLIGYSTILDYSCGRGIAKANESKTRKRFLWISMIGNLGLLGFFKYYDFFASNINALAGLDLPMLQLALPIGISFYTFQTMSYTIDVYLGNCQYQKNIISFGCYVTMFPQLIAGPIVRYVDVVKEIDHRKESIDEVAMGIRIFIIGLGKKVLLANAIGSLWDQVNHSFQANQNVSVMSAWLGILAFSFQLYFDFSGYSDMATGMGHMFGFRFPKNFNYPYVSLSISDFWRRWHMTLGTWFKEYVYIPLGGNRTSQVRWFRNVAVVWFLTGLWHGANWNYIAWGLYFGLLLVIEKMIIYRFLDQLPKFIRWAYTMLAVLISWVLFSLESMPLALQYLKVMFGWQANGLIDRYALYQWSNYGVLMVVLAIAATPLWKLVVLLPKKHRMEESMNPSKNSLENALDNSEKELSEKSSKKQSLASHIRRFDTTQRMELPNLVPTWTNVLFAGYCLLILLASMAYLVDASYNPFLYFRF